jgi:hypothetical protein
MTKARGETYWISKNPETCLCVYFPGFLDTKSKTRRRRKRRKKSKER